MTFLNIALLGGVLAFNIPLIIHLINRSRFRVVKWGAMHLLDPIVRINRKRVRLEQLLLLLVRALIPVCLALAMASPVLTGCQNLAGNSKSSLVLLLDNSYSMAAGGANANFKSAVEQTTEIIKGVKDGSDMSVILMAGNSAPILDEPTFKKSLLVGEIERLNAAYGMADVPQSLRVGSSLINGMKLPKRDMVVVSDFQRVSWKDEQGQARQRVTEWLGDKQIMPSLTFLRVGKEVTDNVAVTDMKLSRLVVGVGQRITIRANLKNFGDQTYTSLRVYLDIDGQRQVVREVDLGPKQETQGLFTHTFDTAGSHIVKVWADADATLKDDNSYLRSVQVLDRIPVLLVDGDPDREFLKSETGFFRIAMQPFTEDAGEGTDLLNAKIVTPSEFNQDAVANTKVIVLANVPRLSPSQLQMLDGFVKSGGGLLVFPGSQIDADWYNANLYASGTGMMPMRFASLAGDLKDEAKHAGIVSQAYTHPALNMFNDRRNGNLSAGRIWVWYQLAGNVGSTTNATASSVLARLETGDPFLVEKPYGDGNVMLCSTACDFDWNNLPSPRLNVYLPLWQQVVSYLAVNVEPPRNVSVGQSLLAFVPSEATQYKATLTDPSGQVVTVPVVEAGGRGIVEYKQTDQLGLYTLNVAGQKSIHFVVDTPRIESDLAQLSEDEVGTLAESMGADVVTSWDEYAELDKTRRHGSDVWHWFFWAVLALFFAELMLQHWFATRKL